MNSHSQTPTRVDSLLSLLQFRGYFFWLMSAFILAMEAVALYYQYELGYEPCVLCIHVRVWLVVLLVPCLLACLIQRTPLFQIFVAAALLVQIVLAERAWQLLATERGWAEGSCSFDLGFPGWFTPDVWLPWIFEARDLCGYTPYMLFGVSMAEMLMVIWPLAILFTAAQLLRKR